MPRYIIAADVPPGTTEASPVTESVTVTERVVVEGFIFIYQGSKDEVRAAVFSGARQILPDPSGSPQRIPGVTTPGPVRVKLPGTPAELTLRAFAPNAANAHDAIAVLDVEPPESVPDPVRLVGVDQTLQPRAGPNTVDPESLLDGEENG